MAKGIYERRGLNGDVTYYIRHQVDGTDSKERVRRKSRGFTREMAKDALRHSQRFVLLGQIRIAVGHVDSLMAE
jgi:hypothetical protein